MGAHGLAWLSEAPAVEQILADENLIDAAEEIVTYVDSIVCTTNPAIAADGSNAESAPIPKTNPHICNKPLQRLRTSKWTWLI